MAELKPLSPTEYLRTFGASDNEGEWQGVDTSVMTPFGALTDAGKQRNKLRALQGGLMEGYQDYVKKFNAQHIKQLLTPPSYEEAGRRIGGMEKLAPQRDVPSSNLVPISDKGFPDVGVLPGTFDINALQPATGYDPFPAPIAQTIPFSMTNAPLSPADAEIFHQQLAQPSTVDTQTGQLIPLSLAKPRPDLVSPEDVAQAVRLHELLGNVPPGTTSALLKAPLSGPIPVQVPQAALADAAKRQSEVAKNAKSLNLIAAQKTFGKLPKQRQTLQEATAIADAYPDVSPGDIMDILKDPNKPVAQINLPANNEKEYGKAFSGKIAESDINLRDQAQKAPDLAERADRVLSVLENSKAITGFAADFRLNFAKALHAAGLSDSDAAATTEVLATDLASNTLDAIKSSGLGGGTGFSNADRDFLEKAKGGKITLEAGTIARLAGLARRAAEKSVDRWNARLKQIPKSATEGTGVQAEKPIPRAAMRPSGPKVGAVEDGYRFKGGDPADPKNWEKVK